jgi:tetratricopeptide (TPR) repeat protein
VARCLSDYERAGALYEEALTRFRDQGQQGPVPPLLHNLGYVAHHSGDGDRALQLFEAALKLYREQGDERGVAECLAGIAGVFGVRREWQRAARIFGYAEALIETTGTAMWPSNVNDYRKNVASAKRHAPEDDFIEAWREGRGLSLEAALALVAGEAPTPEGAPLEVVA